MDENMKGEAVAQDQGQNSVVRPSGHRRNDSNRPLLGQEESFGLTIDQGLSKTKTTPIEFKQGIEMGDF